MSDRLLLLVRHAKAARPPATADHDRPLTPAGVEQARAMGTRLETQGLVPDLALVSPAARAAQTWHEVADQWAPDRRSRVRVVSEASLYEATPQAVLDAVELYAQDQRVVVVCAHEPALSEVAHLLAGPGSDPLAVAGVVEGLRTGSAAVITVEGGWVERGATRLVAVHDPRVD